MSATPARDRAAEFGAAIGATVDVDELTAAVYDYYQLRSAIDAAALNLASDRPRLDVSPRGGRPGPDRGAGDDHQR